MLPREVADVLPVGARMRVTLMVYRDHLLERVHFDRSDGCVLGQVVGQSLAMLRQDLCQRCPDRKPGPKNARGRGEAQTPGVDSAQLGAVAEVGAEVEDFQPPREQSEEWGKLVIAEGSATRDPESGIISVDLGWLQYDLIPAK